MIAVLDASAAIKLVLDEAHSEQVRRLWDAELTMLAPGIVAPEVGAALEAAHRDGRIGDADADLAQRSWGSLLQDVHLLSVDAGVADRARKLAATRAVRGMDAIYLAVARQVAHVGSAGLLSYDLRQRSALEPDDHVHVLPAELDG